MNHTLRRLAFSSVELLEELEFELSDELLSGGGEPPLLLLGMKLALECEELDGDSELELLLSLEELLDEECELELLLSLDELALEELLDESELDEQLLSLEELLE